MKHYWKKIRYRLEWIGLEMLVRTIPRLPRRVIVWLAWGIGSLGFIFDGRGKKVALANIEAAFGDQYTPRQRREIARASYCGFVRTMLDLRWAPSLTPENFRRYIRVEGIEVLQKLRDQGQSAIVIVIHHGNFEWASLAGGFEGMPGVIVTESFKNEQVSAIFKRCRESAGHRMIPQENSMIRMLKHVKKGGRSGMLLDLNMDPGEASTVIDTFGLKLCATFLHAVLALRGGARLVPLEGRSQPDGTCLVVLHPPIEIPPNATYQQVAQQCWDFFEPVIRENPHHWMWAYKHWRYKPAQTDRAYPFYAYEHRDFEALLERVSNEINGT